MAQMPGKVMVIILEAWVMKVWHCIINPLRLAPPLWVTIAQRHLTSLTRTSISHDSLSWSQFTLVHSSLFHSWHPFFFLYHTEKLVFPKSLIFAWARPVDWLGELFTCACATLTCLYCLKLLCRTNPNTEYKRLEKCWIIVSLDH